jgi:hypothetical protein
MDGRIKSGHDEGRSVNSLFTEHLKEVTLRP